MWTIAPANPQPLSPIPTAAPIALLLPAAATPIASLDLSAPARDTTIALPIEPATATVTTATTAGNQTTFTAPLEQVDAIVWAGQTYTAAEDPTNPRSNEFTQVGQTIAIPQAIVPSADLPIVAIGGQARIPTDLIDGNVLAPLAGLPVMGKLAWSEQLEQPPTGSIALVCFPQDLPAVRSRLKKGTELRLFDRGWSVASFTETLKEDYYEVSVSLTGRWAAAKYQQPVRLLSHAMSSAGASERDPDPDCVNGTSSSTMSGRLTVSAIAARANVPFRAEGDFWGVDVPIDSPADATASWDELAQSRARINNCFLDYGLWGAVHARSIDSGASWQYRVKEIGATYQGDARNAPDYRGYAVEYANAKLSYTPRSNAKGDASRPDSQKPLWVPKPRKKLVLRSGDTDVEVMPAQTDWLKKLDLNWDASGPTKTLKISTTEDGMPSEEEEIIYGFCYEARSIVNNQGELKGSPGAFWKQVSYKKITYLYDPVYGYALGSDTTGWRLGRFKQETEDGLETIAYNDGQSAAYLALYAFRQIPLKGRSRLVLKSFASTYNDVDESAAMVGYKVCNIDGTSRMAWIKDPTYAPAMYVSAELTYTNSFAWTPNPDATPEDDPKLCPYTTGEESIVQVSRQIVPSKTTKAGVTADEPFTFPLSNQQNDTDRFIERRIEDSAQGANFKDKAVHESFTENEGRPSVATRRPPGMERKEPEPDKADEQEQDDRTIEYTVCTPGFKPTDPINGSLSYDCYSVKQALIAAKADLKIRDIQQSIQYKYAVPPNARIRPLDRIRVLLPGETLKTRVVSVAHEYNFEGAIDGLPIVTASPTQIGAGIDREIPVTLHARKQARGASSEAAPPIADENLPPPPPGIVATDLSLGQLIDGSWITRRNF